MTPTDFSPVKVGSLDETADYEGDEWDTSRVDEEEEKVANGMRSDTVNMLGELAGGSADAVRLLTRHADIFVASWKGDAAAVKVWLTADSSLARTTDDSKWGEGYCALHYAAYEGHTNVCEVLLHAGAAVNQLNDSGCTALYLAAQQGHADVVKLMIDSDADVFAIDSVGGAGYTAADVAANGEIRSILVGMTGCVAPPALHGPAVSSGSRGADASSTSAAGASASGAAATFPVVHIDWALDAALEEGVEDDGVDYALALATTSYSLELVQRLCDDDTTEEAATRRLALVQIARGKAMESAPEEAYVYGRAPLPSLKVKSFPSTHSLAHSFALRYGRAARLTLRLRRADVAALRRNLCESSAKSATVAARVRANNGVGASRWSPWSLPCILGLPPARLLPAAPLPRMKLSRLGADWVELQWQLPDGGGAAALAAAAAPVRSNVARAAAEDSGRSVHRSATSSAGEDAAMKQRIAARRDGLRMRRRLYHFFLRRDPGEVRRVDELVAKYARSEHMQEKLYASLCDRYGVPDVPVLPVPPAQFEDKKVLESFEAEALGEVDAARVRRLLGGDDASMAAPRGAGEQEPAADGLVNAGDVTETHTKYVVQFQSSIVVAEAAGAHTGADAANGAAARAPGAPAPSCWTLSRTRGVVGRRSFESATPIDSAMPQGLPESAWQNSLSVSRDAVEIVHADMYNGGAGAPFRVRFFVRKLHANTLYFFRVVEVRPAAGVAPRVTPPLRAFTAMPTTFALPRIAGSVKKTAAKNTQVSAKKRVHTAATLPTVPSTAAPRGQRAANHVRANDAKTRVVDVEGGSEGSAVIESGRAALLTRTSAQTGTKAEAPTKAEARSAIESTARAFVAMESSKRAAAAVAIDPFADAASAFKAMLAAEHAASPKSARAQQRASVAPAKAAVVKHEQLTMAAPAPIENDATRIADSPLVQLSDVYRRTMQGIVARRSDAAPAGARAVPKGPGENDPMKDALSRTFRRQAGSISSASKRRG
jgi:hypothetical protein